VSSPAIRGLMMMRGVASWPLPDAEGEISQRNAVSNVGLTDNLLSGFQFQDANVQRRANYNRQAPAIGVHHSPVLAGRRALRLSAHSRLNTTTSKPVALSVTSRFASKERGTSGERAEERRPRAAPERSASALPRRPLRIT